MMLAGESKTCLTCSRNESFETFGMKNGGRNRDVISNMI
jgi:hypothetical protein